MSVVVPVERLSVKSRILRSVGYNESIKILEIEFQNGLVYQFSGVPPKVYADLMHSGEPGKYFSEKVRPKFPSKPVVT
ncbi:MAG: KTSC domain-containing protein [Methanoregula sp.]|nr:KTSC domain-containing protein [Methanoregula sp.]